MLETALQMRARVRVRRWFIPAVCALALALPLTALAAKPAPRTEPTAFDPQCGRDTACEVWRRFRSNHPFPVQTFAAQRAADRLVLILSEPALPKAALHTLVKAVFKADQPEVQTRRWMIGEDGWVEDMIVSIAWRPASKTLADDPLADPLLRDQLSLLAERLWGTAFGLQLEPVFADYAARARGQAPNLDPHPGELGGWLRDPQLRWQVAGGGGPARSFNELAAGPATGSYTSTDHQLTLLLLSPADIERAQKTPDAFAADWRARFRHFAVASDSVLGAAWTPTGALAFVGRMRRVPADVIAPLRFETFALLARAGTSELAQSYERTTPLAGKMQGGPYAGSDWAPIYLSKKLIDTEFGALLNITDQMLKSWSMAGQIQYLYFDYPLRPQGSQFTFGPKPLSEIVYRETGSRQVLFNWNTSGSAAVVSHAGLDVLTPTFTGALPITYGAESQPGSGMKFGDQVEPLLRREREAYTYFTGLRDPNLARVVSYTVIYQAFQAHARRNAAAVTRDDERIDEREAAMQTLAAELTQVLGEIDMPDAVQRMVERERQAAERAYKRKITLSAYQRESIARDARQELESINTRIRSLGAADPRYRDRRQLANLLVNLRNEQKAAWAAFDARQAAFNADVKKFNAAGTLGRLSLPSHSELNTRSAELDRDAQKLKAVFENASRLHGVLSQPLAAFRDLDTVRARYVAANAAAPAGWIKTPSVVISRNTQQVNATGGHNIDARALRIEVDPTLTEAAVVEGRNGSVLRVPPGQADAAGARANDLARLIEHGKADIQRVRGVLAEPRAPAMLRTRAAALQSEQPADPRFIAGRGGSEPLLDAALRQQMLALYESFDTPFAGMARREASGDILVLTRVNGKPECCVRVRDLASFRTRLADWKGQGDVALVDFPPAQAEALAQNLVGRNDAALIEAVGGGRGGEPPQGTINFIAGNGGDRLPPGGGGTGGGAGKPPGGGNAGPGTGGAGGEGKPPPGPPGGRAADEPTSLALMIEQGRPAEVRQAMLKPRKFERAADEVVGAPAEAELRSLQDAASTPETKQALKWNAARDGQPVIFRLRFLQADAVAPSLEARVLAGIDPVQLAQGAKIVRGAIETARTERPQQSLFDLQTRVKQIVARDPGRSAIKRLMTYISEAKLGFLMSRSPPAQAPEERS